mmetsp:Transcript_23287/g.41175  ORF Transcript_23287/g.41175 Transcript_23287/m.41175 type:complete len:152 (-) Transcript_23287:57-512(-)|eukprot:CAMPEP_0184533448 /NCGR_PEP_ID=MMETSP0198_2-20121128/14763_1 /TAXON_ID=1112570 /ORGANISM="Thraustochytrium sp., Strain LLF1b" /LENGTH=151 /DNA_ID=CAMNT_0026926227 /DNA_START=154 /DNA_END=609 /DNA_ORIENTATION=+
MNAAFKEVYAQASRRQELLTHKQRVVRLYKAGLKALVSWTMNRDILNEEATKLRARFDAVKTPEQGAAMLLQGEKELADRTHPDPYVLAYMPGGTKFMRNPVPHPKLQYPDGIPEDAVTGTRTPVWPDMVPITWRPHMDNWIIDPSKKAMV